MRQSRRRTPRSFQTESEKRRFPNRHGKVFNHGETVIVHVQNQILAHDGQPNQCDVSFRFHFYFLSKQFGLRPKCGCYDTKPPGCGEKNLWRKASRSEKAFPSKSGISHLFQETRSQP
jgi:hypothetical protein